MGQGQGRIYVALCLLSVLWIIVYWLWEVPSTPGVTFADTTSHIIDDDIIDPETEPADTAPDPEPRAGVIAPEFDTYVIRRDDETWTSISIAVYNTPDHADALADANPYLVRLQPGREVRIPKDPANVRGIPIEHEQKDHPVSPAGPPPTKGPTIIAEHTVESGDVLGGISRKYYASSKHWKLIYDFNKDRLGLESPDKLSLGQVLQIPALPEGQ